jgi:hypothetical protein
MNLSTSGRSLTRTVQSSIHSQPEFKFTAYKRTLKAMMRRHAQTAAPRQVATGGPERDRLVSIVGRDVRPPARSTIWPICAATPYNEKATGNRKSNDMANDLSITYYVSHDMLGVPSDDEVERFKDLLLEAFQDEWPDAQISIEDDEDERAEIDGPSGQFLQDVEDRVDDIVDEILDGGAWQDEEDDLFGDEDESELDDEDL